MVNRENKTERVQLLMSPSELEAIDRWGNENGIRTRAESMRRLCQIGLHLDPIVPQVHEKMMEIIEGDVAFMRDGTSVAKLDEDKKLKGKVKAILERHFPVFVDVLVMLEIHQALRGGKNINVAINDATRGIQRLQEKFGRYY